MLHLNADERRPAVAFGDAVHLSKLPGLEVAGTEIADLASNHEIVKGPHRFLNRSGSVVRVDLK